MRTEMVLDAIEMARRSRGARVDALRCHSDAGSHAASGVDGGTAAELSLVITGPDGAVRSEDLAHIGACLGPDVDRHRRAAAFLNLDPPHSPVDRGSVIKKRRKRMAKKKHRKLLRKTRHQRRNKK